MHSNVIEIVPLGFAFSFSDVLDGTDVQQCRDVKWYLHFSTQTRVGEITDSSGEKRERRYSVDFVKIRTLTSDDLSNTFLRRLVYIDADNWTASVSVFSLSLFNRSAVGLFSLPPRHIDDGNTEVFIPHQVILPICPDVSKSSSRSSFWQKTDGAAGVRA